ncbi:MAG TPA: hypothetical protein DEB73_03880 [Candidatus Magasanikbacteria bacterium]|nr:hypothetical protein [Candidatus Magasanikbacteria bacterium]HBX15928.1 hypothetical protein [Candidatus Magasanikbacteria bacterium]
MDYFNQSVKIEKAANFLKSLQKKWQTSFVLLSFCNDILTLKKINQPSSKTVRQNLKKISEEISVQDIKTAVSWARK